MAETKKGKLEFTVAERMAELEAKVALEHKSETGVADRYFLGFIKPEVSFGDILTAVSIALAALALRLDHLRRKKEATSVAMASLQTTYRTKLGELKKQYPHLDDENVASIFSNDGERESIEGLLAMFEHLAGGVNSGVYDLTFLDRLSGNLLLDTYLNYRRYMEYAHSEQQRRMLESRMGMKATKYDEFTKLSEDLARLRGPGLEELIRIYEQNRKRDGGNAQDPVQ